MKILKLSLIACVVLAGYFTVSAIAHSHTRQTARNSSVQRNSVQQQFEYATLVTKTTQQNNRMVYTVTWNAGLQDVVGQSTNSIADARRQLTARLGTGNNTRTNLSVLLSSIGNDGWKLVESTTNELGTTRIFIRLVR